MDHEELLKSFDPLFAGTGGIDSWIDASTPPEVVQRLLTVDQTPLSRAQLNQLLVLSHEAGVSDGCFRYYWLDTPRHTYDVKRVPGYDPARNQRAIGSLRHLYWGLYRVYIDALLYFGNVRAAYRFLRELSLDELTTFFDSKRVDVDALLSRGPALQLRSISRDNRYLISEMACKSLDASPGGVAQLRQVLTEAFEELPEGGVGPVTVRELLDGSYVSKRYANEQQQLRFSADALLDDRVATLDELDTRYQDLASQFERARTAALENTRLYLSMIEDLDVYVATSMRTRDDFRAMAIFCDAVFSDTRLQEMNVRYFDPTMSAADGHEDKGLIECLMVKSAKVLVYFAGVKESWGKDVEAAMALSLGKPVIFFCDEQDRARFYREVHPLTRLIQFSTGVAVGAMVACSPEEVAELVARWLRNEMEYEIAQPKTGYLHLQEKLTGSVVRLQTNDELLRETFWNYYHAKNERDLALRSIR